MNWLFAVSTFLQVVGIILLTVESKYIKKKRRLIIGVIASSLSVITLFFYQNSSSKELDEQLDRMEKTILEIKNDTTVVYSQQQLAEIDSIGLDFIELVKQIDKDRAEIIQKKLEIQYQNKKTRIELSKEYRPKYLRIVNFCKDYIKAFNNEYNKSITVRELGEIPVDMWDNSMNDYEVQIQLDSVSLLRFDFFGIDPQEEKMDLPSIYIKHEKLNQPKKSDYFEQLIKIEVHRGTNTFKTRKYDDYFDYVPSIERTNLNKFEEKSIETIKYILDYELAIRLN